MMKSSVRLIVVFVYLTLLTNSNQTCSGFTEPEEANACKVKCDKIGKYGNISNGVCEYCPDGEYENNNTDCVNLCIEPKHKFTLTSGVGIGKGYCFQCPNLTPYYLNNNCVASCNIRGLVAYGSPKFKCSECLDNKYEFEGICINSCPINTISITTGYRYCMSCPVNYFVENNTCVINCILPRGYKKSDGTCGICGNDQFYNAVDQLCQENCPSFYIKDLENKTCSPCPLGTYFEDNTCTSTCTKKYHVINKNLNICERCSNAKFAYKGECLETCYENTVISNNLLNLHNN